MNTQGKYVIVHHYNFANIKKITSRKLHFFKPMILQFLTLQSPMVTICTTSLTFNNSTFCPHSVFMCFVWIWEQTAIISMYSINLLVFINETECVYCAVRSTFYVLPTHFIYVFCVDLRTNSDYFTVQHWLVGFYNWDRVCLLRGTFYIYVLPTQCIYVFCVDLRTNSYYFTVQHWLVGFYNWDRVCVLRGTIWVFICNTE